MFVSRFTNKQTFKPLVPFSFPPYFRADFNGQDMRKVSWNLATKKYNLVRFVSNAKYSFLQKEKQLSPFY